MAVDGPWGDLPTALAAFDLCHPIVPCAGSQPIDGCWYDGWRAAANPVNRRGPGSDRDHARRRTGWDTSLPIPATFARPVRASSWLLNPIPTRPTLLQARRAHKRLRHACYRLNTRLEQRLELVGESDSGPDLVLVLHDRTVARITHQSLVIAQRLQAPVLVQEHQCQDAGTDPD